MNSHLEMIKFLKAGFLLRHETWKTSWLFWKNDNIYFHNEKEECLYEGAIGDPLVWQIIEQRYTGEEALRAAFDGKCIKRVNGDFYIFRGATDGNIWMVKAKAGKYFYTMNEKDYFADDWIVCLPEEDEL